MGAGYNDRGRGLPEPNTERVGDAFRFGYTFSFSVTVTRRWWGHLGFVDDPGYGRRYCPAGDVLAYGAANLHGYRRHRDQHDQQFPERS